MRAAIRTFLAGGALVAGAAAALPAAANECEGYSPSECVPIYGCVEPAGVFFHGRSVGRGEGTIEATLQDGKTCTGFWQQASTGEGRVYGDCQDGRTFAVTFAYAHEASGTFVAEGATATGEQVNALAGWKVSEYLRDVEGNPNKAIQCGKTLYPVP